MKYLTLVRHAKSSWTDFSKTDHDRTLNDRGLKNAPAMGRFLANTYFGINGTTRIIPAPDRIVSSSAVRTMETARLLAGQIQFDTESLIQERRVYLAEADQLMDMVRQFDNDWAHVMLVAHNNGISEFANRLLSKGNIGDMPTCAVALLEFALEEWGSADFRRARLIGYITPKLLEKRFPESTLPAPFEGVDNDF